MQVLAYAGPDELFHLLPLLHHSPCVELDVSVVAPPDGLLADDAVVGALLRWLAIASRGPLRVTLTVSGMDVHLVRHDHGVITALMSLSQFLWAPLPSGEASLQWLPARGPAADVDWVELVMPSAPSEMGAAVELYAATLEHLWGEPLLEGVRVEPMAPCCEAAVEIAGC